MWSHDISLVCKVCEATVESLPHLFFSCNYSWQVSSANLIYVNIQRKNTFAKELVEAVKKARSKSSKAKIFVIMFTKSLYAMFMDSKE